MATICLVGRMEDTPWPTAEGSMSHLDGHTNWVFVDFNYQYDHSSDGFK